VLLQQQLLPVSTLFRPIRGVEQQHIPEVLDTIIHDRYKRIIMEHPADIKQVILALRLVELMVATVRYKQRIQEHLLELRPVPADRHMKIDIARLLVSNSGSGQFTML